ncbi:MAG: hypothetical protein WBG95_05885 [Sulfitobacter sp.]
MNNQPGTAPNFRNACIVMFGVNVTWVFVAIWAIWGLIAVAAIGWCINLVISYMDARRG